MKTYRKHTSSKARQRLQHVIEKAKSEQALTETRIAERIIKNLNMGKIN